MNIHTTLAEPSERPHLLMCPPRHFAVTYSINPWMDPTAWADRDDQVPPPDHPRIHHEPPIILEVGCRVGRGPLDTSLPARPCGARGQPSS